MPDNAHVHAQGNERGVRLRLKDIPWTRVAQLDQGRTAVFMLSGPLEQHGPHLPLGTDYQAPAMRNRAVNRVRDMTRIHRQSAAIGRALIRCYARVFGDLVLEHLGGGDVSDRLKAVRRFGG